MTVIRREDGDILEIKRGCFLQIDQGKRIILIMLAKNEDCVHAGKNHGEAMPDAFRCLRAIAIRSIDEGDGFAIRGCNGQSVFVSVGHAGQLTQLNGFAFQTEDIPVVK
ncbi:hypothetical protein ABB55_13460 [Prosthecomicrobium hirschii]|uniref:Uncharacterized protein n=1 Tax=Prosthecodimorpha hirschii TaxID=665126 RepID=A0A0P6WER9_9HYPH|nr:hypothetical protein ABB55_13460 [Prosthecomicrobium hirschii]